MKGTSEGEGIRCATCGGIFPLATLAPGVTCPYCGAAHAMDGAAIAAAQGYRQDFFQEMRGADAERQRASAWSHWSSGSGRPTMSIAFTIAMLCLPVLLGLPGLLIAFGPIELAPELHGLVGSFSSFCTIGAMGTFMIAYVVWTMRRTRVRSATEAGDPGPPSKVSCPHCGAPGLLAPGQHVQTCGHCRGALVPSRTIIAAGLDVARAQRRAAELERYRAERHGMLGIGRQTQAYGKLLPLFYVVPFAPMVLGICVVPLSAGRGHVTLPQLLLLGVPLLLVVALVSGLGAFLFVRARQRRQAWRQTLADLARQFGGRACERVEDLVAWLDAGWAGPYDARFIGGGPRFGAVLLEAWGFGAAVALNPEPQKQPYQQTPTYVRVLLAAWIPSASDGGPPPELGPDAQRTVHWLRAAGFLVSCEQAGILAMAQEPVVDALRRTPSAAHHLAPVIGHLARLAHEIGARPVPVTHALRR